MKVLHVPGHLMQAIERDVEAVGEVEIAAAKEVFAILREAASIAESLAEDVKKIGVAIAAWGDGCMGAITTALASVAALAAAIGVFIAGIPADATGIGAAIGVPAQVAALAGAIAAAATLLASVVAVVECKQLQLQAARDKQAQDEKEARQAAADKKRDEEIAALKKAVAAQQETKARQANVDEIKTRASHIRAEVEKLKALATKAQSVKVR